MYDPWCPCFDQDGSNVAKQPNHDAAAHAQVSGTYDAAAETAVHSCYFAKLGGQCSDPEVREACPVTCHDEVAETGVGQCVCDLTQRPDGSWAGCADFVHKCTGKPDDPDDVCWGTENPEAPEESPRICPAGCQYTPANYAYVGSGFSFCTDVLLDGPDMSLVNISTGRGAPVQVLSNPGVLPLHEACGSPAFARAVGRDDHGCTFHAPQAPATVTEINISAKREFPLVSALCAGLPLLEKLTVDGQPVSCNCGLGNPEAPRGWCPHRHVQTGTPTCIGNLDPADDFACWQGGCTGTPTNSSLQCKFSLRALLGGSVRPSDCPDGCDFVPQLKPRFGAHLLYSEPSNSTEIRSAECCTRDCLHTPDDPVCIARLQLRRSAPSMCSGHLKACSASLDCMEVLHTVMFNFENRTLPSSRPEADARDAIIAYECCDEDGNCLDDSDAWCHPLDSALPHNQTQSDENFYCSHQSDVAQALGGIVCPPSFNPLRIPDPPGLNGFLTCLQAHGERLASIYQTIDDGYCAAPPEECTQFQQEEYSLKECCPCRPTSPPGQDGPCPEHCASMSATCEYLLHCPGQCDDDDGGAGPTCWEIKDEDECNECDECDGSGCTWMADMDVCVGNSQPSAEPSGGGGGIVCEEIMDSVYCYGECVWDGSSCVGADSQPSAEPSGGGGGIECQQFMDETDCSMYPDECFWDVDVASCFNLQGQGVGR